MDEKWMRLAMEEAMLAIPEREIPVGAVIVRNGEVVARAHNKKETKRCAVYHAEIEAITAACETVGSWYLDECDMYVTLEPCPMCAGAIINSRIKTLYFGAYDPKAGCCGTLYNLPVDTRFNHRPDVEGGILQEECGKILTDYFKEMRNAAKARR